MIINCPSCRTRYRTPELGPGAHTGRCSRCDESFDLVPGLRQYRLLPDATPRPVVSGAVAVPFPAPQMMIPPSAGPEAGATRGRRNGREWFGLLLLTSLGAAAGFHGAVIGQADLLSSTAAGTVGGLILGWSWIRTAERKR